MDDTTIKLGAFDQTCFYKEFKEFAIRIRAGGIE
mgnify:CR=1 FL=1